MDLKDFAQSNHLLGDESQVYGRFNGYQVTLIRNEDMEHLRILSSVTSADNSNLLSMYEKLNGLVSEGTIVTNLSGNGIINVNVRNVTNEELNSLLIRITDDFKALNLKPACYQCHEEKEKEFAKYKGVCIPLCDKCYNSLAVNVNVKGGTYHMGVIGALLGGIVGSILWIVVGLLGYVAAIAGLVVAIAAAKGYTLFNGKISKLAPIIIGGAALIAVVLAQFITLDLQFYKEFKEFGYDITLIDALKLTFKLPYTSPEVTSGFYSDMALGLGFAGLGAFGVLKNLFKVASVEAPSLERV